jgi:ketosteroid isomerase-like protein
MLTVVVAGSVALLAAACQTSLQSAYVAPSTEASAIRIASLLEADRAFSARAREVGAAAAFSEFMAEDGKLLGAGEDPVVGTEAIYSVMAALPAEAELSWEPIEGVVADSGELGVTWGEYRLTVPGDGGAAIEETGRYVTVWRKDEMGRWRGLLDIGT